MKILTDENIAKSVVHFLRNQNHDVVDVKEDGKHGIEDTKIIVWASQEKRIILTHDKDFIDFFSQKKELFSVIVVRIFDQRPQATIQVLERLLPIVAEKDIENKLVIGEMNRIKIVKK